MRIVQINLNHCEAAQDLLSQRVKEIKADIAIISEPYRCENHSTWASDSKNCAAIWLCGELAFQENNSAGEGFVRSKINGINFVSCYARPSLTTVQYEQLLQNIVLEASGKSPLIIAGDFNAWATEWGSRRTNKRGEMLLEAFAPLHITVLNSGSTFTYRKMGIGSVIDITLANDSLAQKIKWRVSEGYTHSDHQAIIMDINERRLKIAPKPTGPKWKDAMLDSEALTYMIEQLQTPAGSAENRTKLLVEGLREACDASMPRRVMHQHIYPCYWWNENIKSLRSQCLRARRKMQRSRGRPDFVENVQNLRSARQALKKAIKTSKQESFKKLCEEADINPWGTAYRVVLSKAKSVHTPQITCPIRLRKIVTTLFPQRSENILPSCIQHEASDIPRVTEQELQAACNKIKPKKAPGPDGIPNRALKLAISKRPDIFQAVFQTCLNEGTFPKRWKKQTLVLLPKGNKKPGEPESYRPICLLDTMGKILERIICDRLSSFAEDKGILSTYQFGFRKSRSTVDAIKCVVDLATEAIEGKRWRGGKKEYCAVVTLDVRNAFNTASWQRILETLAKIGSPSYIIKIIESYFRDRKLRYRSDKGVEEYIVSAGVPQGSVLGPLLWNLMYDGVLRLNMPPRTKVIGFADDIAVVMVAKHIHEIERIASESVSRIKTWLRSMKLELAEHKTDVVLISSRKIVETISVNVGSVTITSKPAIKYLGVMVDSRLNFKTHLEYAVKKASSVQVCLSRIMPNNGGPSHSKRMLYSRVVSSVLLYAAPIWADALNLNSFTKKLTAVYRLSALRTICGFRTISDDASFVIAGLVPVDILAKEMQRVYIRLSEHDSRASRKTIAEEERRRSIAHWQDRWNRSPKGRWTHGLIPILTTWLERKHGETNFHLTQFLSGHGVFRKYLHRFGHDSSPNCPICTDREEDADHVLFQCPRYAPETCGILNGENIIDFMLKSSDNWKRICAHAKYIHNDLRRAEVRRRSN